MVVDDVALDQPKTKDMAAKLRGLNVSGYITILVDEINTNAMLASSNIPGCYYHHINYLNPVALLKSQHVMVTKSALAQLEERLA
jgi:large subunit ribosomal protein L4